MSRWEREELGSIVDLDRDESNAARATYDDPNYVVIRGQEYAVWDAPEPEDWQ